MTGLRYMSVCSGIEAASVAWHPLGWRPVGFAEIEKFPAAVLAHHYPGVPNYGDMTGFEEWQDDPIDLLVGGTPCQSFSVAGLRAGLADPRGNLMLTYGAIAARRRPRWLVWENVPGVLSSNGGRDFAAFLSLLGQLGYGWAYRVLDAQYVRVDGYPAAVPQRRRRVFVVGYFGDWRRAAAVLFDRASLSGDNPPRRKAGQNVAPTISARPTGGGGLGTDFDLDGGLIAQDVAPTLNAHFGDKLGLENQHINGGGGLFVAARVSVPQCGGTGRGTPIVPVQVSPTLRAGGNKTGGDRPPGTDVDTCDTLIPIAIQERAVSENPEAGPQGKGWQEGVAYTLEARNKVQAAAFAPKAGGKQTTLGTTQEPAIVTPWAVRRLTPRECERLQGFPDDYTLIPYRRGMSADGPRYKALGNSMAVNVMRWIGRRIEMVEGIR